MKYLHRILTLGLIAFTISNFKSAEVQKEYSRLSAQGTYCNNYEIRGIYYFIQNGTYGDYTMFNPVCDVHDALQIEFALKHSNWKPKNKKYIYHSFDSFFTGSNNDGMAEDYKADLKEIRSRVYDLLKGLK